MMERIARSAANSTQFVDVRRAGGGMHTGVREKVCETRQKEFAGVVGVESAYQAEGEAQPFLYSGGRQKRQ
eukprot:785919-Pleurochrysis_carterae.AAC.1